MLGKDETVLFMDYIAIKKYVGKKEEKYLLRHKMTYEFFYTVEMRCYFVSFLDTKKLSAVKWNYYH